MMQITEPWVASPRSVSASTTMCSLLEIDPHHDPPECGPADLGETGGGEDAAAAHVELSPGDLLPRLGEHRVALEGTGAALAGEVGGRACERAADPAAPEARAGDEAGHGPDAVVGLVLRSSRPRGRECCAAGAGRRCAARPR